MKLAALIAVAIGLSCSPAHAEAADPNASVDPAGNTSVGVSVSAPGSASEAERHAQAQRPLVDYDITWQVLGDGPAQAGNLSGLCLVDVGPPAKFGFEYRIMGTDLSGTIVSDRLVCMPFVDGEVGVRPPEPQLPQPPTVEEAWANARIPAPVITLDPSTRGITGLETRISTTGPATFAISATVRGYTITGIATLDHYTISVDGQPATNADNDRYVFETKGRHTIAISAVWHGRATLTGDELSAPVFLPDIGTATVTATRTYEVNEVRSVLQP